MNADELWTRVYEMGPSGWADYLTDFTPWNWYSTDLYAYNESGYEYRGYDLGWRDYVGVYFDDLLYYAYDWTEEEFVECLAYQVLSQTVDFELVNRPESHERVYFHR
jgi:hypothetical protein